jgi:putative membrane protein
MSLPPSKFPSGTVKGWSLFFCGICMGAADIVPGISGGTVAFILGFYQPLLVSLKTFNYSAVQHLFRGNWQALLQQVAWKFLLTLLAGIVCAMICLANLLQTMLAHEVFRIYLYAAFQGLVSASLIFCLRQVQVWNWQMVIVFGLGSFFGYELTGSVLVQPVDMLNTPFVNGWLILCGALAACALLLPGISGSYLLTLLGVYPIAIKALVDFINELKQAAFDHEAFAVLGCLALGIVIGILAFSRVLSWLLQYYPNQSIACLSGFMIGSLRSIWPFWSYDDNSGPQPFLPAWNSPLLWQASFCALIGFVLVFSLEFYAKRKQIYIS